MERTVYLVRHGQSESNAGLQTKDATSINLTALGRRQAETVSRFFKKQPDLVVVSPYLRAIQTAEPFLKRMAGARSVIWPVQEFTYLCGKKYAGTSYKDRKKARKRYWENLNVDYVDGVGSESFRRFMRRVSDFLDMISDPELEVDEITVFTHGQFTRGVFLKVTSLEVTDSVELMARFRKLNSGIFVPNCSVTELRITVNEKIFISGPSVSHLPAELRTD